MGRTFMTGMLCAFVLLALVALASPDILRVSVLAGLPSVCAGIFLFRPWRAWQREARGILRELLDAPCLHADYREHVLDGRDPREHVLYRMHDLAGLYLVGSGTDCARHDGRSPPPADPDDDQAFSE